MKILHVITSLHTGGAEKLMVDLIPRFKEEGIECDLLTFNGEMTSFRQSLEKAGINVYDFGKKNTSVYSPMNLIRLFPYLKKYDIIHTHNTAPQLFVAIASVLCSVVLVTTEHTTSNRRRNWRWYVPIDRWMYSRYKRIICISEKTEEKLRQTIGDKSDKILTIHNGIDVRAYMHSLPKRIKMDFPKCNVALVHVAGFRYQKDQDTVIRALTLLGNSIHLFLVGDGPRRKELEALVSDLALTDRVHFLGIRNDVANILKGADIAVMSSHWEGFGLAAVEAMSVGIPTVASNIDGLAQVVDGAGLLFERSNYDDLACKLRMLIEDRMFYTKIALNCSERANKFDISYMVAGYSDVYRSLI